MNSAWSRKILESLFDAGVRDVVYCAGARNSPLLAVLEKAQGLTKYSFFEERSAGFFALGLARKENRPVAIITTSGTAAANLLPPIIEAFHVGVPLIAVTADRPRRLRGTGAPQAIDQLGLFEKFVSHEFDIEDGELPNLGAWSMRAPIHINVCFDEPLIDTEPVEFQLSEKKSSKGFKGRASAASSESSVSALREFLADGGPLLLTVGTLETETERESVCRFLKTLRAPCYLEGTSGIRERKDLSELSLRSGDKVLSWALKNNLFSRVLRIGGVPTVRIWRDLDVASSPIEVCSLNSLPFAGLSRGEMICADIAQTLDAAIASDLSSLSHGEGAYQRVFAKDREASAVLENLLESEPTAEPSLIHAFSKAIAADSTVYVGNSLPIREWDLAASREKHLAVEANRGVNGIDGQTSTFFGLSRERGQNWALIGDLTALYDLSAPWALSQKQMEHFCVVVINNGGGMIFNRIFNRAVFENRHEIGFEAWAKLWNLSFERWTSIPKTIDRAQIVELVPDPKATTRFWNRYDELFV
jgi:2-succinyl-5-enolpyruvyl-6-hydroxy-3-cyclohexene-1-carboxylate synthase